MTTNKKQPNARPKRSDVLILGEYLRSERLRIGIESVKDLVELMYKWIKIPPELITDKQIYNLEGAVKFQCLSILELGAFASLADALLNKQKPPIKFLYSPKYKRSYKAMELAAIGMGWLDPSTGELTPDIDLDPKIQETFF